MDLSSFHTTLIPDKYHHSTVYPASLSNSQLLPNMCFSVICCTVVCICHFNIITLRAKKTYSLGDIIDLITPAKISFDNVQPFHLWFEKLSTLFTFISSE